MGPAGGGAARYEDALRWGNGDPGCGPWKRKRGQPGWKWGEIPWPRSVGCSLRRETWFACMCISLFKSFAAFDSHCRPWKRRDPDEDRSFPALAAWLSGRKTQEMAVCGGGGGRWDRVGALLRRNWPRECGPLPALGRPGTRGRSVPGAPPVHPRRREGAPQTQRCVSSAHLPWPPPRVAPGRPSCGRRSRTRPACRWRYGPASGSQAPEEG